MCTVDQVLSTFQTPTVVLQWKPDVDLMSDIRVLERYTQGRTEDVKDIGDLIAKAIIG